MNGRFSRGVIMLFCLQLGVSLIEFGIIQSVYSFSVMCFEIPSGIIGDKFKRKSVLSIGSGLCAISALSMFYISIFNINSNVMIIISCLVIIDAFGGTLISGTDKAILYDHLNEKNQKNDYLKVLSNTQIISLISLAMATATGGKVADTAINSVYLLQFISYVIAAVIILLFDEVNIKKTTLSKTQKKSLRGQLSLIYNNLKNSKILVVMVMYLALFEVLVNTIMIFIQGAFSSIGLPDSIIGYIISATTVIGILGAVLSRYLERADGKLLLPMVSLIICMNSFLFSTNSKFLMVLGFGILNLLLDAMIPYLNNLINNEIATEVRATIISISSSLTGLIAVLFYPIFGSLVSKLGYSHTFLFIGLFFGLGMFFGSLLIYKNFRKKYR